MSLLSATLGRFSPKFRTFGQWIDVYQPIIESRDITQKTKENRRNNMRHLLNQLGDKTISRIGPQDIAQLTRTLAKTYPHAARRVLIEARGAFDEAIAYGWVVTNPAAVVKTLPLRVARNRLSFEAWQAIHAHAAAHLPPWISRMLVLALVSGQRRGDLQKMKFSDVRDGYLHVAQQKGAAMVRIPLTLRLDAIDTTLEQAIEACRDYAPGDEYLLRKTTGQPLAYASLSARFEDAREGAIGLHAGKGAPPSLHEIRSLSERLYREQGVDTKTLLGHRKQRQTDCYNADRGLSSGRWKTLEI